MCAGEQKRQCASKDTDESLKQKERDCNSQVSQDCRCCLHLTYMAKAALVGKRETSPGAERNRCSSSR